MRPASVDAIIHAVPIFGLALISIESKIMQESTLELPFTIENDAIKFEISAVGETFARGYFRVKGAERSRLEYRYTTLAGFKRSFSILANSESTEGSPPENFLIEFPAETADFEFVFHESPADNFRLEFETQIDVASRYTRDVTNFLLFDISDLVYYIGHHDHLTGIQRVQASILLGMISEPRDIEFGYITYNNRINEFQIIDSSYAELLLRDLSLPTSARRKLYDPMEARLGVLPKAESLEIFLADKNHLKPIIYLLGAAWVNQDYFLRISNLKRAHGALFCMTVHDLIPIYAKETCDQGTAIVFEEFLRKAIYFTDHFFTVSEYTACDLLTYVNSLGIKELPVSTNENAHTFDEFFPAAQRAAERPIKRPFVLFVSTIEGRKNHSYIFDVWEALSKRVKSLPMLVCVGRLGWRAEAFLEKMLTTNNLNGNIRILSDISDAELEALYQEALFTVYPSVYEGWGLPVGESIAKGKICVSSDKSSIPEVAKEFGVYVDIGSVQDAVKKIQRLIEDDNFRAGLESNIKNHFKPRTWKNVATQLINQVQTISNSDPHNFPMLSCRKEYRVSRLPPRVYNSLGGAMVAEVEGARRSYITGRINTDADLIAAQATRLGKGWCAPENWGTWSRWPKAERQFFIQIPADSTQISILEKIRVVAPLIGSILKITVCGEHTQYFPLTQEALICKFSGVPVRSDDGDFLISQTYEIISSPDMSEEEIKNIDRRMLGIGFETLIITDENDFSGRLELLERYNYDREFASMFSAGIPASRFELQRSNNKDFGALFTSLARESVRRTRIPPARQLHSVLDFGSIVVFSGRDDPKNGALLSKGWVVVPEKGVWTEGAAGELSFQLPDVAQALAVVAIRCKCVGTSDKPVQLGLLFAGKPVDSREIIDSEFHDLTAVFDTSELGEQDIIDLSVVTNSWEYVQDSIFPQSTAKRTGAQLIRLAFHKVPNFRLGVTYTVNADASFLGAFTSGWYEVEDRGVWSGRDTARFVGSIGDSDCRGFTAEMDIRAFGASTSQPATVEIFNEGEKIYSIDLEDDGVTSIEFPVSTLERGFGIYFDIGIKRIGSLRPCDIGNSADSRYLGVFVKEVRFKTPSEQITS